MGRITAGTWSVLFGIILAIVAVLGLSYLNLKHKYDRCLTHAQQIGYTLEQAKFECKYRIK